jgi:thiamine-phosphate pyrophosphorylase
MSHPPAAQAPIERLIDANLDRAREGLRVMEEWARFGLERPDLVWRCKDLRQRLGQLHDERYKFARDAAGDPATGLAHPAQVGRRDGPAIVAANAARVQEALRVLEEFGRLVDGDLAVAAAACRYSIYDLEVALLRATKNQDNRRARLAQCRLYLVTSPVPQLAPIVEQCLQAGLRLVQYRAKPGPNVDGVEFDDRQRLEQARQLRRLCLEYGALFLINDRIDLALAVDADGVHLGQGDLPVAMARRLLGPERLIGCSTHAIAELRQAVADGCDYVGVGPVQATPTKPGREPVGLAYVAAAAQECPVPFFAIGGIDTSNMAEVQAAGATRVAVVRALTEASSPALITKTLLNQLANQP